MHATQIAYRDLRMTSGIFQNRRLTVPERTLRSRRKLFQFSILMALALLAAAPLLATTQTYYFTGVVDTSGFTDAGTLPNPLPPGTMVTGSYSFDDAAVDSNGDPNIGTYATGSFIVNFGAAEMIAFDSGGTTGVGNDVPCCIPGFTQDTFSIRTTGVTQTTTFTNAVSTSQSSLSFGVGTIGSPTALTSDALTDVPQVIGTPWTDNKLTLNFSASGDVACGAFQSSCYVNINLTELSTTPPTPVPAMPNAVMLVLAILLALIGAAALGRRAVRHSA